MLNCEEPVDLDVVIPQQFLLISSTMVPAKPVEVTVTSSNNVISGNSDTPIKDAVVELFVAGNEPVARLQYVAETNGLYRADDYSPIAGITYEVRVVANGFDISYASSFVPPASELNSITTENIVRTTNGDEITYSFDFGIEFDDPEGEVNYYNLRLYQERKPFTVHHNGDTTFNSSEVSPMVIPPSATHDYKLTREPGGILFVDNPFRNQSIALSSSVNASKEKIGTIYAELRTVSEEYYLFQESIINTSVGINGGITSPNNSYSNVTGGGGTVTGYSSTSDSLSLDN